MPRRGALTSSGGTRPPRPPPSRETTVSKAMSYILRHAAEKEGLKLDENGYANVADLVRTHLPPLGTLKSPALHLSSRSPPPSSADGTLQLTPTVPEQLAWPRLKSLHVTLAELQRIVAENDKQRFALLRIPSTTSTASTPPSTSPSDYLIRASQGHSLPIASANLLTRLLPTSGSFPAEVVHGTSAAAWTQILASGGLKRMGRRHVHFAWGEPGRGGKTNDTDTNTSRTNEDEEGPAIADNGFVVRSGMRATASVLVWVDVRRAMDEGGLEWWVSGNGVVLTEGDGEGMVGLEFVRRVVRRGTGEVLWLPSERGGGEGGAGSSKG